MPKTQRYRHFRKRRRAREQRVLEDDEQWAHLDTAPTSVNGSGADVDGVHGVDVADEEAIPAPQSESPAPSVPCPEDIIAILAEVQEASSLGGDRKKRSKKGVVPKAAKTRRNKRRKRYT